MLCRQTNIGALATSIHNWSLVRSAPAVSIKVDYVCLQAIASLPLHLQVWPPPLLRLLQLPSVLLSSAMPALMSSQVKQVQCHIESMGRFY
jgi:hypothetical protein